MSGSLLFTLTAVFLNMNKKMFPQCLSIHSISPTYQLQTPKGEGCLPGEICNTTLLRTQGKGLWLCA